MAAERKPYPDYKDFGVEGLGKVPAHWEVRKLKSWLGINELVLSEDADPEYRFDYLDIGLVDAGRLTARPEQIRFRNSPSRARRVVRSGDTLVSTVRTYLKAVWHADDPGVDLIASTGFAVLTPRRGTLPRFVSYVCQSDPFTNRVTAESVGIAYPAISETKLGTFEVCVPPVPEQAAIVRFLNHADRRIQRYIRAKDKLIALLEEQKKVLIQEAVTGQLDVRTGRPYPTYKESGVEWLGAVPAHWNVWRSKRVFRPRTELARPDDIQLSATQAYGVILEAIGNEQRTRRFAIIIDEAHSSQGGRTSASMSAALGTAGEEGEDETFEDRINRVMESRKLLPNVSYFAFTATPKNKTLEIFGAPDPQSDGAVRHRAFHSYTMKQAIQEGFILDVLAHYTPVASYYRLAKTVEDDPEFDARKAQKKLRRFVEGHDHAIRLKAEIMVDHFQDQVLAKNKIGGQARAMVVTNGIERAIQYFHAIRDYLKERKNPYRPIVAFSGEPEFRGQKVTETSLNGFPSGQIAQKIKADPYRFLVCADKFQTGYDEPLLHTMYVDKTLSGIKAVQTLSRLNRARPKKHDVFVLDFLNDADTIGAAFADFYRATILADETDPNKLHDLQADLDATQVYSPEQVDDLVNRYLDGTERDELDPILDVCVAVYVHELSEDAQVDFKSKAKAFVRTYGFLSCVLPYTNAAWEKRSIFLNFLISKLPAPREEDLSKGILDAIDMDSYRVEKRVVQKILLPDEDAEVDPGPTSGGGHLPEPELDRLSNILKMFNDLFGDIAWEDRDRVGELIAKTIPARVAADPTFRNARRNSDEANTRIEHDRVLGRIVTSMMKDDAELFKQFMDNEDFKRWMTATVYERACNQDSEAGRPVNTRTAAGLPQEAGATPGRRSSPCSPSSNSV